MRKGLTKQVVEVYAEMRVKGSTANPEWCLALVEDAKMLQPAPLCGVSVKSA